VLIPFAIMIVSSFVIMISLIKTTKNLTQKNPIHKNKENTFSNNKKKRKVTVNLLVSDVEADNETTKLENKTIHSLKSNRKNNVEDTISITNNTGIERATITQINECTSVIGQQSETLKSTDTKQNQKKIMMITAAKKKKMSTASQSNVSTKAKNVSAMLATNNFLFISLTLPIVVFLSIQPSIDQTCDYVKAKLLLIKVLCIILMNSNCTINIFIYIFMSSQFKFELMALLRKFFYSCCLFCPRYRPVNQDEINNFHNNNNISGI
jgi:hypothetical protein